MDASKSFNKFTRNDVYEWVPQAELIERLSKQNIVITAATLRNWEKAGLITPPYRTGRRGGKITLYPEFVLAECYAVYLLSQPNQKIEGIPIPKFSLAMLGEVRKDTLKNNFHLHKYPVPEEHYQSDTGQIDEADLLEVLQNTDFKNLSLAEITSECGKIFVTCLWVLALQKGCEFFLTEYRR